MRSMSGSDKVDTGFSPVHIQPVDIPNIAPFVRWVLVQLAKLCPDFLGSWIPALH